MRCSQGSVGVSLPFAALTRLWPTIFSTVTTGEKWISVKITWSKNHSGKLWIQGNLKDLNFQGGENSS